MDACPIKNIIATAARAQSVKVRGISLSSWVNLTIKNAMKFVLILIIFCLIVSSWNKLVAYGKKTA